MRFVLPVILAAYPGYALALDACKPSTEDNQARICVYAPNQRYVAVGVVGIPVNLVFGHDEEIKRYSFAYTGVNETGIPVETWRGPSVVKKKDEPPQEVKKGQYLTNLPITPYFEGTSALIVITTLPDNSERPYRFTLVARKMAKDCDGANSIGPGCIGDNITTSQIMFDYPADRAAEAAKLAKEKKEAAVVAWQVNQKRKIEQTGIDRLRVDVTYGKRNKDYTTKGELKYKYMSPLVFDNGQLTAFWWPGNIEPPTITVVDPVTGDLRPADTTKQGELYVTPTVANRFRLFGGKEAVLDVINNHWSPNRPDPGTGTTSPDVVRSVIYEKGAK